MFDCFKMHAKCKAICCTAVAIEKEIFERNRHRLVRPIEKEMEFVGFNPLEKREEQMILPITKDAYCPFLLSDLRCGIQDDKPYACKKFGSEEHPCFRCPYQDKDGRERSRQEMRKICRDGDKVVEKLKIL